MKLEFMKTGMEYLRPILRDSRTVEETAEAIIPDSCPDAGEVLYTSGLAFIRGKELSDGMLSLSAGVSATAMIGVDGRDTPELVEVYIPMSLKLEHGQLHSGQSCRVAVQLRRLDGHLVNPRKVMVRATVAVSVWVYDKTRQEHLTECTTPEVQILHKTAPVCCLKAMGEKNYTVEDTVTIPGKPAVLGGCQIYLEHTDARLTGTRGVLKGMAELEILFLDENGKPGTGTAQIPFSQYIDLGDCQESDELRLYSFLTGADITMGTEGSLNVTIQLTTTAEVWGRMEITYIGDMYSLKGEVVPELEEQSYDSLIDRQMFVPVSHGVCEASSGKILYTSAIPGEITCRRKGETAEFSMPVAVHLLYEGEDGLLRGGTCRAELTATTQASERCRFEPFGGHIAVSPSQGGTLGVKVTGNLSVATYGTLTIQEVVAGEWQEETEQHSGPGLIIRRPRAGESLWELAKHYRTTQESIAQANGLEGEVLGEKMLLIPRGR